MATTERAVLAGGCFWGMQDLIRRLPGVEATRVGYTGGEVPNATYRNHGHHAEGIEILFDPAVLSYRRLLEFFFQIHDPSTPNRQGNDRGPSYRSAIYYVDEAQRRVVDHEGGPLLVLAGPGTGKTTTLVEAIAQRIADGARPDALYGLSFDAREDGNFRYAVALEVPEPAAQPDGVRVITSAPGAYAVFRQRTPVAELPARFDAIFAHWLPAAPYTQREGAVFERYPDDDAPEDGKMLYEIWVPVTADETRNAARTGT